MNRKVKIMFIINPFSGIARKRKIERIIETFLDHNIFDYSISYIQGPSHAYDLAADAVKNDFEIVVAVGGDGSVNLVAKALVGTKVRLGIIPTGSGNGLARFLKIPLKAHNALKTLNHGSMRLIDTATVNDEFFISIAGIGFDARVADQFAKQSKRGFISYLKISLKEFLHSTPKPYKIIAGNDVYQIEAFFICMANSNQFGYNTAIAPDANIDDGLLDISIVGKPPLVMIPFITYMLFTGRFNRISYVRSFKASSLKLIQKDSGIVNLDGDPVEIGKELTIKVNPLSLNVVVP